MSIVEVAVTQKWVKIKAVCEECSGELKAKGIGYLDSESKAIHVCDGCGVEVAMQDTYPKYSTTFEEIS